MNHVSKRVMPSENILKLRAIVKSWDKSEEILLLSPDSKRAFNELRNLMSQEKPDEISEFERLYNKIKITLSNIKII